MEAVELVVVAGVDDRDHVGGRHRLYEPREEAGGTDTTGKRNEHARNVVRACSFPCFEL